MDTLKEFLSRQSTEVLQCVIEATTSQDHIYIVQDILNTRSHYFEKYSHDVLNNMSKKDLINLLNDPILQIDDIVISHTIITDILNIMSVKHPDANIYYSSKLIQYLREHCNN